MHRRGEHIGLVSTFSIERMERLSYGARIQNFLIRDFVVDSPSLSSNNNLTQILLKRLFGSHRTLQAYNKAPSNSTELSSLTSP